MPLADKASKEDVHVLHKRLLVDVLVVARTVEHEFENQPLHSHWLEALVAPTLEDDGMPFRKDVVSTIFHNHMNESSAWANYATRNGFHECLLGLFLQFVPVLMGLELGSDRPVRESAAAMDTILLSSIVLGVVAGFTVDDGKRSVCHFSYLSNQSMNTCEDKTRSVNSLVISSVLMTPFGSVAW